MKMNEFFKSLGNGMKAKKSTILTAVGITGMIFGTVLAVKATPKAMEAKKEAEEKKGSKLTVIETVKVCGKYYIWSGIATVVGSACIIKSDVDNAVEKGTLTSALVMAEAARTKFEEKTVELIGEKKTQAIRDEVNKDIMKENPVQTNTVIITSKGNTLIMDSISKQYFRADIDFIKKQVPEFNLYLTNWRRGDGKLGINAWYDMINIDHLGGDLGDDWGWDSDKDYFDITFTAGIADNGEPCLIMDYPNRPHYIAYK